MLKEKETVSDEFCWHLSNLISSTHPQKKSSKLGYPKCLKNFQKTTPVPFVVVVCFISRRLHLQYKSIEVQIDGLKLITLDHQPGETTCLFRV